MKIKHFLFILLICSPFVFAQTSLAENKTDPSKISSLIQIVHSISVSEKKISDYGTLLGKEESQKIKEDLESKIKSESDYVNNLKNNLNIIVSEVDPRLLEDNNSNSKIDWSKELEELLSPLINEVKKLTSRPRELDRLHRRFSALKDRIEKEAKAIENIENILKNNNDSSLDKYLKEIREDWKERTTESKTQLSIAEQKLNQLDSEKTDFGKSIKEIPNIFFRSRGRNLVLAFLATLIFWWGLRRAYNKFTHLGVFSKRDSPGLRRTLNLMYLFFSGSGSFSIFILVLFLLGDWVLVILSLLLVLGIFWTSKHALPQFWSQGALLLNIGPVRERERIFYNNILWEVSSLNLYSTLKNPLMSPASIRVPLSDLLPLRSRPEGQREPWFPTKEGDWILINGEIHARVINQTPSQVVLVQLGGSRITYDVPSFISANPLNLSGGFRISKKLGLDYSKQDQVATTIPILIKTHLEEEFSKNLEESQFKIIVEFLEAGASSVDILVQIDFSGDLGAQYHSLQRLVSKYCLDLCIANNWEIPFTQISVHMNNHDRNNEC